MTLGHFNFWLSLSLSESFAERNFKLNAKVRTWAQVQLNFGLSLYLDRKFGPSLSLSEMTLLFDLSLDLDRTLAQRKAQRQAKSKVKVTHNVLGSPLFPEVTCCHKYLSAPFALLQAACSL